MECIRPRCNALQNAWGHTALMEAVCYSNKEAASRLLEANCDFNLREVKAGESALHVSVRKNYTTITDQLLTAGAAFRPVYNYQVCIDEPSGGFRGRPSRLRPPPSPLGDGPTPSLYS